MNLRLNTFLVTISLLSMAPARARAQDAAAVHTPTAASVIERYFEVTNFPSSVEEGKMLTLKGRLELVGMGLTGTFEQSQAVPPRSYIKMSIDGIGDLRSGFDGEVGWSLHPMTGAHLMEGDELFHARLQASVDAMLRSPEVFETIELEGSEEFEGRACHKIKLVAKPVDGMDAEATEDIRTKFEYYEIESGYLYATVQMAPSPMGKVETTLLTTNYEEVDGVRMPKQLLQKSEAVSMKLTVTSAEYGEADAATFALPKQIQTLKESRAAEADAGSRKE